MALKFAAIPFLLASLTACGTEQAASTPSAADSALAEVLRRAAINDTLSFPPSSYNPPPIERRSYPVEQLPEQRPSTSATARQGCSTYQSLVANVWPGKELFLASDCSPIGRIVEVRDDYRFPDGTERDAILISFNDGSSDWVPRKTAQQIYRTR